ncbi:hypothetical protein, partial [Oceanidesulfovibrio marinus]
SAMGQVLLGKIGSAGGGINALRGAPNVQGFTDPAIVWHIFPGTNPVPKARQDTPQQYLDASTPISHDPKSANWWQQHPEHVVSPLNASYGDAAPKDNDVR